MSTVLRSPLARRPFRSTRARLLWVAGVVAGAVCIVVGSHVIRTPSVVHQVTVVNPTDYSITVSVSGSGRSDRLDLTTVPRRATTQLEEVLDQGPVWVFHFGDQGFAAADLPVTRAQLSGGGWRIEVPQSVAPQLHALGASPDPDL